MSITAYVGRPRSGKSYGVVEHAILPACLQGRPVYTNVPVYVEKIQADYPLADITRVETQWFNDDKNLMSILGGALIVMDEAWRIFPAGQAINKVSKERSSFLAEHGHRVGQNGMAQSIVLVVQDLVKVANWARIDIDKTYVATKLDAAGMDKKFRVDIYQGMVKGPRYPQPDLGYLIQEYNPKIYQYYQSHTMSETGKAGIELQPDKRATVLSHPMVKFGIPIGVLSILLLGWNIAGFFTNHPKVEVKPATQQATASKQAPSPQASQYKQDIQSTPPSSNSLQPSNAETQKPAPIPPLSTIWRIVGVTSANGVYRVHLHSDKGNRTLSASKCAIDEYDTTCVVDGTTITRYSGPEKKPDYRTVVELNPLR